MAELLPQDFVCIEVEVEWPDDKRYYRAFVCDVRNGVHLLCYVDEQCGSATTEELALQTTYRKWRFAVLRKHEDHLVGRRCIIDRHRMTAHKRSTRRRYLCWHVERLAELFVRIASCLILVETSGGHALFITPSFSRRIVGSPTSTLQRTTF